MIKRRALATAFVAVTPVAVCASAMAGVDNFAAAARESQSGNGSMPIESVILGLLGAAWLGWAGREDGMVIPGAAVGLAIGSAAGLAIAFALR